jgi:hypothetical protein
MNKDITKNLTGQLKRKDKFGKVYFFNSTTVTLFSDVMNGVGRNLKLGWQKRGLESPHADRCICRQRYLQKKRQKCKIRSFAAFEFVKRQYAEIILYFSVLQSNSEFY